MYYYHCVDAPRFPNILLCHFWQRTVSFSNFRRRESLFKYLNTRNSVLKRKIIFRGEILPSDDSGLEQIASSGRYLQTRRQQLDRTSQRTHNGDRQSPTAGVFARSDARFYWSRVSVFTRSDKEHSEKYELLLCSSVFNLFLMNSASY